MHHDTLLRLVGRIYDAATDPGGWDVALTALSEVARAPIAGLLYHDLTSNSGGISAMVGADPDGTRLYNTHYHAQDPWIGRAQTRGLLQPGVVLVGEQVISHQELKKTAYYNEFANAHQGVRLLGATILRTGSAFANLSLLRGERNRPFAPAQARLIESLMPHLQRAMGIHARLQEAARHTAGAGELLDRLQTGVVLLSESGRVLFANRMARSIAATQDGFRLDKNGPAASLAAESAQLRRLVALAANPATRGGGILRLSRPSLRAPLVALVSPLTNPAPLELGEQPLVGLFLTDPEIGPELDLGTLQRTYALAPAEALIARSLCRGATLQEIATEHGHTIATTRWYVKQILQKVGVDSQVALVRQLITGPAAFAPPSDPMAG